MKCFICDYLGETTKQELTKCNHICWKNTACQIGGHKLTLQKWSFFIYVIQNTKYSLWFIKNLLYSGVFTFIANIRVFKELI